MNRRWNFLGTYHGLVSPVDYGPSGDSIPI